MKPFEFWHPRLAEAPYYAALATRCLAAGLPPKFLAKANYALDHGELGLGSKYTTQMAFNQRAFPRTVLIDFNRRDLALDAIDQFLSTSAEGAVLKPDIGAVGKAIIRLDHEKSVQQQVPQLTGRFLLQAFCNKPEEFGVFYVRQHGLGRITGINRKHFPTVTGDGIRTLEELVTAHERYTGHWRIFMKYHDRERVLDDGEVQQLSFIGSHTMGCKFTNDTDLTTPELRDAVNAFTASQPGFNFGRLDVRAENETTFQKGEFTVIEVNGIASLPTHMFDPSMSIAEAYAIFLLHAKLLVDIACEHRHQDMQLDSYRRIWQLAKANLKTLNRLHEQAMDPAPRPQVPENLPARRI